VKETRTDSGEKKIVFTTRDTQVLGKRHLSDWWRKTRTENMRFARNYCWDWLSKPVTTFSINRAERELTPRAVKVLGESDPNRIIEFRIGDRATLYLRRDVIKEIVAKRIVVSSGAVECEPSVFIDPSRIERVGSGTFSHDLEQRPTVKSDAAPANETQRAQGRQRQSSLKAQQAPELREQLSDRIGTLEKAAQAPDLTEDAARQIMRGAQEVLHELGTNDLIRIIPLLKRLGLLMVHVGTLFPTVSFPRETVESLIHADRPRPGRAIASTSTAQETTPKGLGL
jgi:hypothetical protein